MILQPIPRTISLGVAVIDPRPTCKGADPGSVNARISSRVQTGVNQRCPALLRRCDGPGFHLHVHVPWNRPTGPCTEQCGHAARMRYRALLRITRTSHPLDDASTPEARATTLRPLHIAAIDPTGAPTKRDTQRLSFQGRRLLDVLNLLPSTWRTPYRDH